MVQFHIPSLAHTLHSEGISPEEPTLSSIEAADMLYQFPLPATETVWKLPDIGHDGWMDDQKQVVLLERSQVSQVLGLDANTVS
jgi:hypothetical protein